MLILHEMLIWLKDYPPCNHRMDFLWEDAEKMNQVRLGVSFNGFPEVDITSKLQTIEKKPILAIFGRMELHSSRTAT